MNKRHTALLGIVISVLAGMFVLACGSGSVTISGNAGNSDASTATAAAVATATSSTTAPATNTPIPPPPTSGPPAPTATPSPASYTGIWINDNPNTNDVTKISISVASPTIYVHGYGRCSPTYCDWGLRNGTYSGTPFSILFDFGGGLTHKLILARDATGLKVTDIGSSSGTANLHFHQLSGADYDGTWLNNDASTNDVPKVVISHSGSTMTVHGYGACTPSYCDWNTRSITLTGDPFSVLFDFGGGLTHTLTIGLDGPNLVITDVGSHSGTATMYFHK